MDSVSDTSVRSALALFFAIIAGLLVTWATVGKEARWLVKLLVGAPAILFTYALLYNRLHTR